MTSPLPAAGRGWGWGFPGTPSPQGTTFSSAGETPAAPSRRDAGAPWCPHSSAGETPALPAGETPALPAGETPALPAGETPALPAGETPALPAGGNGDPATGLRLAGYSFFGGTIFAGIHLHVAAHLREGDHAPVAAGLLDLDPLHRPQDPAPPRATGSSRASSPRRRGGRAEQQAPSAGSAPRDRSARAASPDRRRAASSGRRAPRRSGPAAPLPTLRAAARASRRRGPRGRSSR